MNRITFVVVALLLSAQHAIAQQADSIPADTYLDRAAADHVRLARARRQIADLSVERYKALSKERMSVGLRGIRRDRLLYRREVAGRLEWSRSGAGRIEILGAREAIPVAIKGVQLPNDLDSFMPHLAFDPADNRMLVGWDDDEFVRHPFAPNAERYYRYRTGTTTSIQLPDGKAVRLVEIEIIPRVSDPRNISGSFWLEVETHSIVQASFRLARDIDILRDIEDENDADKDEIPGFLRPMTATIDFVTVEYGLYDLKWWMPRSMLFEGAVRAGMMRLPMQYERTYSGYEIEGRDQPQNVPIAEVLAMDSARMAATDSCNRKMNVSVNVGVGEPARVEHADSQQTSITQCGRWVIVMPTDTTSMLTSPELPPDIFATGEQLISENELEEFRKRIEDLGGGPSRLPEAIVNVDLLSPQHVRYNRIEGLSLAAHGDVDFGSYKAFATARIGIADRYPNFEIGATRLGQKSALTLGAYRRLNAFDPFISPFSIGASASALLFGRDDANYYRSLGVELKAVPAGSAASWYSARLYAQRERAASKQTDFSVRNLMGDFDFADNLQADRIDAYGGELTLRYNRGLDPEGFRMGVELYGHGAGGTSNFGRSALTVRAGIPLPGALTGALEGAAGFTSVGAPLQHNWYVGGPGTLRGYRAGVLSGETFWRGRAEVGYGLPAFRLVGFSDAAWAGVRDDFSRARPLLSAGAGISLMDGILRFDVARGLREPKGWTTTLYFDAAI